MQGTWSLQNRTAGRETFRTSTTKIRKITLAGRLICQLKMYSPRLKFLPLGTMLERPDSAWKVKLYLIKEVVTDNKPWSDVFPL